MQGVQRDFCCGRAGEATPTLSNAWDAGHLERILDTHHIVRVRGAEVPFILTHRSGIRRPARSWNRLADDLAADCVTFEGENGGGGQRRRFDEPPNVSDENVIYSLRPKRPRRRMRARFAVFSSATKKTASENESPPRACYTTCR